jgi:hypothetical protein
MKIVPRARRALASAGVRACVARLLALALAACASGACGLAAPGGPRRAGSGSAMQRGGRAPEGARRETRLEERAVEESSGLAASRLNPGIFWTHNDSGDGPYLYALDAEGRRRGVWRVSGARAVDWEDMAAGPGPEPGRSYLKVGDIGDNGRERAHVSVYRVPEPRVTPEEAASTRRQPRPTAPAEELRLKYPDGAHNAEALLVHPTTGDLYVVVKNGKPACGVYRLRATQATAGVNTLERAGEFRSPSPLGSLVTGGAISPDGRRVVICDYLGAYELRLPDAESATFEEVWRQTPAPVALGPRDQGEAVCYRPDGAALLATSEGSPALLVEVALKE